MVMVHALAPDIMEVEGENDACLPTGRLVEGNFIVVVVIVWGLSTSALSPWMAGVVAVIVDADVLVHGYAWLLVFGATW